MDDLQERLARHIQARYKQADQGDWDSLPEWKRDLVREIAGSILTRGGVGFAEAFMEMGSSSERP